MTIMPNSCIIIQSSARENAKSNIVYYDYNGISMIYDNSNMALLRVRNN